MARRKTTTDLPPAEKRPRTWRELVMPVILLGGLAVAWGWFRPEATFGSSAARQAAGHCQANLQGLAAAFALYAQDYEGALPRATDPESTPQYTSTAAMAEQQKMLAQLKPLPTVLDAYVKDKTLWRCPSDIGWGRTHLMAEWSPHTDVRPSAWQRLGSSYKYWNNNGLLGLGLDDLRQPALLILMNDRETWHRPYGRAVVNVLYADGHLGTSTAARFRNGY